MAVTRGIHLMYGNAVLSRRTLPAPPNLTGKIQGYVSMDLKLDGDDLVKIIALAIKKLNKAKALFESLM